jgi:hypothetical protein
VLCGRVVQAPMRGQPMSESMESGVTKAVSIRAVEREGVQPGITTRG